MRGNFHRGVHPAGGGAADEQWHLAAAEVVVALHLGGHMLHFFEARGDEAGQPDDVGAFFTRLGQNVLGGHHHAHVHHFEVVALEHHGDDVLADVVHVALHRGDDDLALGAHIATGGLHFQLLGFDVGQQMGHGLLHHPRTLDDLGQEHLARAEQVADHVHAVHQRAFDDVQRPPAFGTDGLPDFFGVFDDEVGNAVHQRVAQTLAHRQLAPGQSGCIVFGRALHRFGHFEQALGGVGAAVEHHVFHALAQLGVEVVVNAHLPGVDDAHVHPGGNGVIQEHGVDGLAHRLVAAEAETHVGHAARHLGTGQVLLDPARGVDEIDRVVVVLLDAGGDGENVGIENDVFRRKPHLIDQQAIGALADLRLALESVGLPLLIERHDHGGRAIAAQQPRLADELDLSLFHGDGVHHRLALHAAQPRLDHAPLGTVDHHRHTGDVGLGGHEVEKAHHRRLAVEHGFVHIDIDDLRAVFHLLPCHGQRLVVLPGEDHAGEGFGTRHIGALADVDEQRAGADDERLEAGELQRGQGGGGCVLGHGISISCQPSSPRRGRRDERR